MTTTQCLRPACRAALAPGSEHTRVFVHCHGSRGNLVILRVRAQKPRNARARWRNLSADPYARAVVPEGDTLSVDRVIGVSMEDPMAVASSTHDGTGA
jgi:hypothetical protein